MKLYAWVGEDEFGSGVVGLKAGYVPAGMIPLVCIESHLHKLNTPDIRRQLQAQATKFRKEIRLAEFEFTGKDLVVLTPE